MAPDVPPALPAAAVSAPAVETYFGGPDRPPGVLRDLLKAKVDAAPPGSEIVWATYYFRDQELAESLVAAQRRGVRVRVRIEGKPRREAANDRVVAILREGLGDGLRLHRGWFGLGHLHAKVYAFSGPQPEVLIGSFNPSGNPSGDRTSDAALIADIGDQDRGENMLVAFRSPDAAAALRRQAERLWAGKAGRFSLQENRSVNLKSVRFYYFPRLSPHVVERRIARLDAGDRVQAAVSHMDDGRFVQELARAAGRGVDVELVVHDTDRRVGAGVVRTLDEAGADIRRYCTIDRLPMHAKFVLITRDGERSAWFGSLNYTTTSRLLNKEVLARSSDPALVDGLEARFRTIAGTAARQDCAGQRVASTGDADR